MCVAFLPPSTSALPSILLPHTHHHSPTKQKSPAASKHVHWQDLLVFDRAAGTLSLWRITPELVGLGMAAVGALGITAGVGVGGGEKTLHATSLVVANWRLGRGRDGGEVRERVGVSVPPPPASSAAEGKSK